MNTDILAENKLPFRQYSFFISERISSDHPEVEQNIKDGKMIVAMAIMQAIGLQFEIEYKPIHMAHDVVINGVAQDCRKGTIITIKTKEIVQSKSRG